MKLQEELRIIMLPKFVQSNKYWASFQNETVYCKMIIFYFLDLIQANKK